jgi:hypothetical protein
MPDITRKRIRPASALCLALLAFHGANGDAFHKEFLEAQEDHDYRQRYKRGRSHE